jgi:hypothetical protein
MPWRAQLLADVQNSSHKPSNFQRVAERTSLAPCEGSVAQGAGLQGKERKGFVERADLLTRPLRTCMVGGVGAAV